MKTPFRLFFLAFLTVSLAFIYGCEKAPVTPYALPDHTDNAGPGQPGYEGPGYTYDDSIPSVESLKNNGNGASTGSYATGADQNSVEYKKQYGRSSHQLLPIYFDFDQASIRMDQIPLIEQNADYLKNIPSAKIIIEGNSDERGTNEYNLALGERRALNAKKYLLELGIEDYRIRTVSYGEERPLFPEQDDFSWSQNRRDDFVLE